MNDNIDENLKTYAKITFWIAVIAIEILAIVNLGNENAGLGLALMFLGPFICWINSAIIYAIGEIITQLKKNPQRIQESRTIEISKNDELKKYKELYDQGILTEEEFLSKKEQLLKLL